MTTGAWRLGGDLHFAVGCGCRDILEATGFVLDGCVRGDQGILVPAAMVGAKEQFTATWEGNPQICPGSASVTAIGRGQNVWGDSGSHGDLLSRSADDALAG
jgi:hypothetical protein